MSLPNLKFSLPLTILKEGDAFIAYSPALELSSVGDTFEEARSHFDEAVNLFFEEIIEAGTVDRVLTDLGWLKKKASYSPPVFIINTTREFSFTTPN